MSDRRYEDDWYGDEDEGIEFDAYELQRFRRRYGVEPENALFTQVKNQE